MRRGHPEGYADTEVGVAHPCPECGRHSARVHPQRGYLICNWCWCRYLWAEEGNGE